MLFVQVVFLKEPNAVKSGLLLIATHTRNQIIVNYSIKVATMADFKMLQGDDFASLGRSNLLSSVNVIFL